MASPPFGATAVATDDVAAPYSPALLQPRAFQYEMLDESLRRNIIVALIWFLAPNVALADQQAKVITEQIPSVQTRLLRGADGVDHWSEQWIWDDVLRNIKVVISTHQVGIRLDFDMSMLTPSEILLDALIHGFVQMAKLSLLVFDEAHHCMSDHPASRILRDFFHPQLAINKEQTPAILGLTASPVVNSKAGKLEELERNLQAISRTPKRHREELLHHTHLPTLVALTYHTSSRARQFPLLPNLAQLKISLDIEQDPYVKALMQSCTTAADSSELNRVKLGRKTYCQDQLKKLATRAQTVEKELGPWGTYWYIVACTQKLKVGVGDQSASLELLDDDEKTYLERHLSSLLSCVSEEAVPRLDIECLSGKVLRLIDFLVAEGIPGFTGLVFVKTRAEVAVLSELLSTHPRLTNQYAVSTFVGASTSVNRRSNIAELVDVRSQVSTLDDLRLGRKNLVVTTSALEEGIDVSACNVVICFDHPPNLKSLIQRRGRARKSESKFVLMLADDDDPSTISTWHELEESMRKLYEDDMRELRDLEALEATHEGDREFVVARTGAKLLLSDAVSHLSHFCNLLPTSHGAPVFTYQDHSQEEGQRAITAKVVLPISVDRSVREASGQCVWITEKNAKRDAAFEAYKQLYGAGLISDNLLPIRGDDEAIAHVKAEVGKIPSLIQVAGQSKPWHLVARQWQAVKDTFSLHCYEVLLQREDETIVRMHMLLPCSLPVIRHPIPLFWDASTTFSAKVYPSSSTLSRMDYAVQSTDLLFSSVFRSRMEAAQSDYVALFAPAEDDHDTKWAEHWSGTVKGERLRQMDASVSSLSSLGIIHDLTQQGVPYILKGFEEQSSDFNTLQSQDTPTHENELYLQVSRFPKRTDFLHPVPSDIEKAVRKANKILLRPEDCEVDRLPLPYVYFAAMVPSILHRIGVCLLARFLCDTLLAPIELSQLDLVITAFTTSAAHEPSNYQRQEYLGDSVLKFLTSLTLMSERLRWHEGVLSSAKDHIVSNASLAKAALETGLDTFIQTKSFTGRKWRPLYVSDLLESTAEEPREMSTKTLADVVEALIGAAFLDGGLDKAIAALKVCLPRVSWSRVDDRNEILFSAYDISVFYPPHFTQLEQLIGYHFIHKALPLEALTHPSYIGTNVSASYERLEFLGDVCLDIIVSSTSFAHEPPISTHGLHLIRTAVVNANFLAFLCLALSMPVTRTTIITEGEARISCHETTIPRQIWQFMRQTAPAVRLAQRDCLKRYDALRGPILESLRQGTHIPWSLLARLDAPKFFSDIIESLTGAIYIDSHGSLAACEAFLETLGVMGYLRRLMEGGVALYHPKEELGQLANTESVTYEIFRGQGGDAGGKESRLGCVVWVGEREVARVGDGLCVLEVETRAAEEAVRILKTETRAKME
ncbi:MAG: hypothetical protein L6R36_004692 [Xanthoria steineri]|nr:MAG: hypothetical protein L6R36_004692 [Xanthoria steineri]